MGKRIDMVGKRFGRLVVVSYNEEVTKQKKGTYWNCRCDCGNEKVVDGGKLRKGHTTSCGCSKKRLDLVGQRFGRLVVISLNEEITKQKKNTYWNCKCDCGNEKVIRGDSLRGGTISCGCYQKERTREMAKEKWQDEEYRQMQSNKMKKLNEELWKDEEFRQMQSELSSKRLKERWQDEDMKWKMGYKGGISPIKKHLGDLPIVEQWRSNSKQQANYTCELTGKVGCKLNTHHLKAFSTIVLEAHELHNIQIKPQVKDYTEEELHKLEEYVASWHKDNSNAVVLCEEAHKLFHTCKDKDGNVLYGSGNNTPEQFEEFRERYIAGEFEGLI